MSQPSPRQREVGALLAAGLGTDEIAERLGITRPTVCEHRDGLYRALGFTHSKAPLVLLTHYAIAHGWTRLIGGRGRPRKAD